MTCRVLRLGSGLGSRMIVSLMPVEFKPTRQTWNRRAVLGARLKAVPGLFELVGFPNRLGMRESLAIDSPFMGAGMPKAYSRDCDIPWIAPTQRPRVAGFVAVLVGPWPS